MEIAGETIYVETVYFNDADITSVTNSICRAVLLGTPNLEDPIAKVEVQDRRGDRITDCSFGG